MNGERTISYSEAIVDKKKESRFAFQSKILWKNIFFGKEL